MTWSPPFLWPGQRIDYYNISVTNGNDGNTEYYRLNSSYSAKIVTFTLNADESHPSTFSCNYITFSIVAFEKLSSLLPYLHESELIWTLPSCKLHDLKLVIMFVLIFTTTSSFTPSVINASVLFKADRTPALLNVYVQVHRNFI